MNFTRRKDLSLSLSLLLQFRISCSPVIGHSSSHVTACARENHRREFSVYGRKSKRVHKAKGGEEEVGEAATEKKRNVLFLLTVRFYVDPPRYDRVLAPIHSPIPAHPFDY